MVRRPAIVTAIIIITIIATTFFAFGSVLRVWMARRPAIVIAIIITIIATIFCFLGFSFKGLDGKASCYCN